MRRSRRAGNILVTLVLFATACGTAQKKQLIETGADASDSARKSTFEATARMLDERPEYVDEFYAIARKHPAMFERILVNATDDLEDEELAEKQGKLLAERPKSLEMIMMKTIEAAYPKKEGRLAIARAIEREAPLVADMQADRKATSIAVMKAAIAVAEKRPANAAAFHIAMRASAPQLARIMSQDPETLGVLTEEIIKVQLKDKPALLKLLKKTGAID